MSLQHFFTESSDKLKRVISAEQFVKAEQGQSSSPFIKPRLWSAVLQFLSLAMLRGMEFFLGRGLLVENIDGELFNYSAPNRRLLAKLLKEKIVTKWECGLRAVDKPAIPYCSITLNEIRNRYGSLLFAGNINGQGVGKTLDEALTIALAETLERIAITEYSPEKLQLRNIKQLQEGKISYLCHSYIEDTVDEQLSINWVKARKLIDNKPMLLPASVVYLGYGRLNPWEPAFAPATSNGCAAYMDKGGATLKAIYELIERDGFLMYWLNHLAPKKIVLDDSAPLKITNVIQYLKEVDIDLHLLDCQTEYGVPILVGVLIDNKTGGIDICSEAGFDIDNLLNKVSKDALRWGVGYVNGATTKYVSKTLVSMEDRASLWRGGAMRKEIDFFLQGEKISYTEYSSQFESVPLEQASEKVISLFKDRGEELYFIELTNSLARTAGLKVVRVFAPSLIPMYFEEEHKPLNVSRLYSFAKNMGYSDREITKEDINQVPHPFI